MKLSPPPTHRNTGSTFVEKTADARQAFALSLHEKETVPKMAGISDALRFSASRSRGINDVEI